MFYFNFAPKTISVTIRLLKSLNRFAAVYFIFSYSKIFSNKKMAVLSVVIAIAGFVAYLPVVVEIDRKFKIVDGRQMFFLSGRNLRWRRERGLVMGGGDL